MRGRLVAALLAWLLVASPAFASSAPDRYLSWSARHHVVHLTLLAGLGQETMGSTSTATGAASCSFASLSDGGSSSIARTAAAAALVRRRAGRSRRRRLSGAASPQPLTGLSPGAKASFTFVANRSGSFRLASLVPGRSRRACTTCSTSRARPPVDHGAAGPLELRRRVERRRDEHEREVEQRVVEDERGPAPFGARRSRSASARKTAPSTSAPTR